MFSGCSNCSSAIGESVKNATLAHIRWFRTMHTDVRYNQQQFIINMKQNRLFYGLIIYSIIITVVAIKYWHLNQISRSVKNFDIRWNSTNDRMIMEDKKTGRLVMLSEDINFDYNFELTEIYFNGVGPITSYKDENDNGYFEKILQFDFNGELVGESLDFDDNGSIDYYSIITETNDTLEFVDKNKNGRMEMR